jgi:hypothetical protein
MHICIFSPRVVFLIKSPKAGKYRRKLCVLFYVFLFGELLLLTFYSLPGFHPGFWKLEEGNRITTVKVGEAGN